MNTTHVKLCVMKDNITSEYSLSVFKGETHVISVELQTNDFAKASDLAKRIVEELQTILEDEYGCTEVEINKQFYS